MSGRVFLFGDDIDTDQLAPGQYMKGGIAALAAHAWKACGRTSRPVSPPATWWWRARTSAWAPRASRRPRR